MLPVQASGSGGGGGTGGGFGGFGGGGGGSGSSGIKRKPREVNEQKFLKGMAVFEGRIEKEYKVSFSVRNSQTRNLTQLKGKLAKASKAEADKFDVERLVGKMSPNDLRDLRYYLDVKFFSIKEYKSEFNKKKKKKKK